MSSAQGWRGPWLAMGIFFVCASSSAWAQECLPGPDSDCDGDLYTPAQGDCDDEDPTVYPGAKEICGDQLDNNCDGFYDGGCDIAALQGGIQGGGGCTGEGAVGGAAFLLIPLLGLGLRRARQQGRERS